MYEFAEGLFVQESSLRFYGFRIQTRMAVVRLSSDRLFLYSPVPLDDSVRAQLDRLGEVTFLVSPNKIHNQTLADYRSSYPDARLVASPGLEERRRDLRFDSVLGDDPDPAWAPELDQALTKGNVFFSEALFLHRPSRTLLAGDFVENFDRDTVSGLGRAAGRLFGVRQRPMASPEFRFYTNDPDAAEAGLARPRAWVFDRIFLCHGRLIVSGARATFGAVCEDLLEEVRGRSRGSRWLLDQVARLQ